MVGEPTETPIDAGRVAVMVTVALFEVTVWATQEDPQRQPSRAVSRKTVFIVRVEGRFDWIVIIMVSIPCF